MSDMFPECGVLISEGTITIRVLNKRTQLTLQRCKSSTAQLCMPEPATAKLYELSLTFYWQAVEDNKKL